ncbi:acyltransferase [Candidatus Omnitrophota bacterium]
MSIRTIKRYYIFASKHPQRAFLGAWALLFNPLIKLYVKTMGAKFGKGGVFLGKPFIDRAIGSRIEIGDYFTIQSLWYLNRVGFSHPMMLQTEDRESFIRIGDHLEASGSTLYAAKGITIGNHVIIGANSVIVDTDFHPVAAKVRDSADMAKVNKKEIVIKDNVWIGMNCIILKGVHIGENTVIAAGSIVTRDIPADCVAAGVPAKVVDSLRSKEKSV